ncbi:MAG: 4Fe-4S binding protein [Oscillospiraceae bacterium]|nr:4Fe-4S binding protein [Oscillospiraceae bacterium]MBQ6427380.1 4Fe-4S binding protein [Oscillospiraceae bacterium]
MRPLILKAARMLTDCMDAKFGLVRMDESRMEYRLLDAILTDDMARAALKMGVRRPTTPEELAKKLRWSTEKTQTVLDEMAQLGIVEYNRHNADRHKQYVLPIFVVGSAENIMLNRELVKKLGTLAPQFFYEMSLEPLKLIAGMVPPGGAGLGFHVIPIERAIPKNSQAVDIEHLSHWLKKYEGHYAIMNCVCRTAMIALGKGCGELPDGTCISLGDYSDYLVETGKARRADYEEVIAVLKRTEANGYMHQITNGDGRDDIFSICNCSVGNCFALRCSQYFNNPNLAASCYRSVVNTDKCVACGKCVEVCPAGAARLGQRLCTKDGPVKYPSQELPSGSLLWGKDKWNENYRNDNRRNCYPTGTAPCKAACPAHVSIQGVLKLAEDGHDMAALKLLRQDNPFPSLCRHCGHPCEAACTRGMIDAPMEIADTMYALAEKQEKYKEKLVPQKVRMNGTGEDHPEKIAVIGADPAALSCAFYLALTGYPVTLFAGKLPCSAAERYILEQLGVVISSGAPEKDQFAAIYPEVFASTHTDTAGMIEDGHQAAVSIHRHIHPGHDLTLARDPREFRPLDKTRLVISPDQAGEHKCLGCGVTRVDPNRCIGCGICTTRCMFGAIRLERSHPEFENYVPYEKAKINTVLNGAKQAGKLVVKRLPNTRKDRAD